MVIWDIHCKHDNRFWEDWGIGFSMSNEPDYKKNTQESIGNGDF